MHINTLALTYFVNRSGSNVIEKDKKSTVYKDSDRESKGTEVSLCTQLEQGIFTFFWPRFRRVRMCWCRRIVDYAVGPRKPTTITAPSIDGYQYLATGPTPLKEVTFMYGVCDCDINANCKQTIYQ